MIIQVENEEMKLETSKGAKGSMKLKDKTNFGIMKLASRLIKTLTRGFSALKSAAMLKNGKAGTKSVSSL